MSNIYIQEPPTNGKILLKTSAGDLEVELWSKEAPLACRNFTQLCLEGYYNGSPFHRVVPGFVVQGGDPTGTGDGGDSVYGQPFRDEYHQRLRFTRRGLVAMATSRPGDNGSQFFITLDRADELNGKHSIFGKVVGDTLYNVLRLAEVEIGPNDRPIRPHVIRSTEVLCNAFDDIAPRSVVTLPAEMEPCRDVTSRATKNFNLLSFGEEAEEEEEEALRVSQTLRGRGKSSHELLKHDARLVLTQSVTHVSSDGVPGDVSDGDGDDVDGDGGDGNSRHGNELRMLVANKLKRGLEAARGVTTATKRIRTVTTDGDDGDDGDVATFLKQRALYEGTRRVKGHKGKAREEQTLALLTKFRSNLSAALLSGDTAETAETTETDDDSGWMGHCLRFADAAAGSLVSRARDPNVSSDVDAFHISDPRNPVTQRRRVETRRGHKSRK
ncbi:unnamed protein product [Lampetra fluviatilis]